MLSESERRREKKWRERRGIERDEAARERKKR
jgi:hypothetical protein